MPESAGKQNSSVTKREFLGEIDISLSPEFAESTLQPLQQFSDKIKELEELGSKMVGSLEPLKDQALSHFKSIEKVASSANILINEIKRNTPKEVESDLNRSLGKVATRFGMNLRHQLAQVGLDVVRTGRKGGQAGSSPEGETKTNIHAEGAGATASSTQQGPIQNINIVVQSKDGGDVSTIPISNMMALLNRPGMSAQAANRSVQAVNSSVGDAARGYINSIPGRPGNESPESIVNMFSEVFMAMALKGTIPHKIPTPPPSTPKGVYNVPADDAFVRTGRINVPPAPGKGGQSDGGKPLIGPIGELIRDISKKIYGHSDVVATPMQPSWQKSPYKTSSAAVWGQSDIKVVNSPGPSTYGGGVKPLSHEHQKNAGVVYTHQYGGPEKGAAPVTSKDVSSIVKGYAEKNLVPQWESGSVKPMVAGLDYKELPVAFAPIMQKVSDMAKGKIESMFHGKLREGKSRDISSAFNPEEIADIISKSIEEVLASPEMSEGAKKEIESSIGSDFKLFMKNVFDIQRQREGAQSSVRARSRYVKRGAVSVPPDEMIPESHAAVVSVRETGLESMPPPIRQDVPMVKEIGSLPESSKGLIPVTRKTKQTAQGLASMFPQGEGSAVNLKSMLRLLLEEKNWFETSGAEEKILTNFEADEQKQRLQGGEYDTLDYMLNRHVDYEHPRGASTRIAAHSKQLELSTSLYPKAKMLYQIVPMVAAAVLQSKGVTPEGKEVSLGPQEVTEGLLDKSKGGALSELFESIMGKEQKGQDGKSSQARIKEQIAAAANSMVVKYRQQAKAQSDSIKSTPKSFRSGVPDGQSYESSLFDVMDQGEVRKLLGEIEDEERRASKSGSSRDYLNQLTSAYGSLEMSVEIAKKKGIKGDALKNDPKVLAYMNRLGSIRNRTEKKYDDSIETSEGDIFNKGRRVVGDRKTGFSMDGLRIDAAAGSPQGDAGEVDISDFEVQRILSEKDDESRTRMIEEYARQNGTDIRRLEGWVQKNVPKQKTKPIGNYLKYRKNDQEGSGAGMSPAEDPRKYIEHIMSSQVVPFERLMGGRTGFSGSTVGSYAKGAIETALKGIGAMKDDEYLDTDTVLGFISNWRKNLQNVTGSKKGGRQSFAGRQAMDAEVARMHAATNPETFKALISENIQHLNDMELGGSYGLAGRKLTLTRAEIPDIFKNTRRIEPGTRRHEEFMKSLSGEYGITERNPMGQMAALDAYNSIADYGRFRSIRSEREGQLSKGGVSAVKRMYGMDTDAGRDLYTGTMKGAGYGTAPEEVHRMLAESGIKFSRSTGTWKSLMAFIESANDAVMKLDTHFGKGAAVRPFRSAIVGEPGPSGQAMDTGVSGEAAKVAYEQFSKDIFGKSVMSNAGSDVSITDSAVGKSQGEYTGYSSDLPKGMIDRYEALRRVASKIKELDRNRQQLGEAKPEFQKARSLQISRMEGEIRGMLEKTAGMFRQDQKMPGMSYVSGDIPDMSKLQNMIEHESLHRLSLTMGRKDMAKGGIPTYNDMTGLMNRNLRDMLGYKTESSVSISEFAKIATSSMGDKSKDVMSALGKGVGVNVGGRKSMYGKAEAGREQEELATLVYEFSNEIAERASAKNANIGSLKPQEIDKLLDQAIGDVSESKGLYGQTLQGILPFMFGKADKGGIRKPTEKFSSFIKEKAGLIIGMAAESSREGGVEPQDIVRKYLLDSIGSAKGKEPVSIPSSGAESREKKKYMEQQRANMEQDRPLFDTRSYLGNKLRSSKFERYERNGVLSDEVSPHLQMAGSFNIGFEDESSYVGRRGEMDPIESSMNDIVESLPAAPSPAGHGSRPGMLSGDAEAIQKNWRRIFDVISAIEEGKLKVPQSTLKKMESLSGLHRPKEDRDMLSRLVQNLAASKTEATREYMRLRSQKKDVDAVLGEGDARKKAELMDKLAERWSLSSANAGLMVEKLGSKDIYGRAESEARGKILEIGSRKKMAIRHLRDAGSYGEDKFTSESSSFWSNIQSGGDSGIGLMMAAANDPRYLTESLKNAVGGGVYPEFEGQKGVGMYEDMVGMLASYNESREGNDNERSSGIRKEIGKKHGVQFSGRKDFDTISRKIVEFEKLRMETRSHMFENMGTQVTGVYGGGEVPRTTEEREYVLSQLMSKSAVVFAMDKAIGLLKNQVQAGRIVPGKGQFAGLEREQAGIGEDIMDNPMVKDIFTAPPYKWAENAKDVKGYSTYEMDISKKLNGRSISSIFSDIGDSGTSKGFFKGVKPHEFNIDTSKGKTGALASLESQVSEMMSAARKDIGLKQNVDFRSLDRADVSALLSKSDFAKVFAGQASAGERLPSNIGFDAASGSMVREAMKKRVIGEYVSMEEQESGAGKGLSSMAMGKIIVPSGSASEKNPHIASDIARMLSAKLNMDQSGKDISVKHGDGSWGQDTVYDKIFNAYLSARKEARPGQKMHGLDNSTMMFVDKLFEYLRAENIERIPGSITQEEINHLGRKVYEISEYARTRRTGTEKKWGGIYKAKGVTPYVPEAGSKGLKATVYRDILKDIESSPEYANDPNIKEVLSYQYETTMSSVGNKIVTGGEPRTDSSGKKTPGKRYDEMTGLQQKGVRDYLFKLAISPYERSRENMRMTEGERVDYALSEYNENNPSLAESIMAMNQKRGVNPARPVGVENTSFYKHRTVHPVDAMTMARMIMLNDVRPEPVPSRKMLGEGTIGEHMGPEFDQIGGEDARLSVPQDIIEAGYEYQVGSMRKNIGSRQITPEMVKTMKETMLPQISALGYLSGAYSQQIGNDDSSADMMRAFYSRSQKSISGAPFSFQTPIYSPEVEHGGFSDVIAFITDEKRKAVARNAEAPAKYSAAYLNAGDIKSKLSELSFLSQVAGPGTDVRSQDSIDMAGDGYPSRTSALIDLLSSIEGRQDIPVPGPKGTLTSTHDIAFKKYVQSLPENARGESVRSIEAMKEDGITSAGSLYASPNFNAVLEQSIGKDIEDTLSSPELASASKEMKEQMGKNMRRNFEVIKDRLRLAMEPEGQGGSVPPMVKLRRELGSGASPYASLDMDMAEAVKNTMKLNAGDFRSFLVKSSGTEPINIEEPGEEDLRKVQALNSLRRHQASAMDELMNSRMEFGNEDEYGNKVTGTLMKVHSSWSKFERGDIEGKARAEQKLAKLNPDDKRNEGEMRYLEGVIERKAARLKALNDLRVKIDGLARQAGAYEELGMSSAQVNATGQDAAKERIQKTLEPNMNDRMKTARNMSIVRRDESELALGLIKSIMSGTKGVPVQELGSSYMIAASGKQDRSKMLEDMFKDSDMLGSIFTNLPEKSRVPFIKGGIPDLKGLSEHLTKSVLPAFKVANEGVDDEGGPAPTIGSTLHVGTPGYDARVRSMFQDYASKRPQMKEDQRSAFSKNVAMSLLLAGRKPEELEPNVEEILAIPGLGKEERLQMFDERTYAAEDIGRQYRAFQEMYSKKKGGDASGAGKAGTSGFHSAMPDNMALTSVQVAMAAIDAGKQNYETRDASVLQTGGVELDMGGKTVAAETGRKVRKSRKTTAQLVDESLRRTSDQIAEAFEALNQTMITALATTAGGMGSITGVLGEGMNIPPERIRAINDENMGLTKSLIHGLYASRMMKGKSGGSAESAANEAALKVKEAMVQQDEAATDVPPVTVAHEPTVSAEQKPPVMEPKKGRRKKSVIVPESSPVEDAEEAALARVMSMMGPDFKSASPDDSFPRAGADGGVRKKTGSSPWVPVGDEYATEKGAPIYSMSTGKMYAVALQTHKEKIEKMNQEGFNAFRKMYDKYLQAKSPGARTKALREMESEMQASNFNVDTPVGQVMRQDYVTSSGEEGTRYRVDPSTVVDRLQSSSSWGKITRHELHQGEQVNIGYLRKLLYIASNVYGTIDEYNKSVSSAMKSVPELSSVAARPSLRLKEQSFQAINVNIEDVMRSVNEQQAGLMAKTLKTGLSKRIGEMESDGLEVRAFMPDTSRKDLQKAASMSKKIEAETYKAETSGEKLVRGVANRVVLYGGISYGLYGFLGTLRDGMRQMATFETQIMEVTKVMNPLMMNADAVGDSAKEMAQKYGIGIVDTAKAMSVFAQQGKSTREMVIMTEASLLAANTTTISAAEATEALTAALRQFNIEDAKAVSIIDSWNEVENRTAITANSLADATKQAGSAAKVAGVGFNELNGMVSAVGSATRQTGNQIGRSLKYIFSNMRSDEAVTALQNIGVATYNNNGTFRDAYSVMADVARQWSVLTDVQKNSIAMTLAGTLRYNTMLVLMDEWDESNRAVVMSLDSQNSSIRENSLTMNTYAKRVEQMNASVSSLYDKMGKSGGRAMMTGIVESFKSFIDLLNSMPPSVIAATTAVAALTGGSAMAVQGLTYSGLGQFMNRSKESGILRTVINKQLSSELSGMKPSEKVSFMQSEPRMTGMLSRATSEYSKGYSVRVGPMDQRQMEMAEKEASAIVQDRTRSLIAHNKALHETGGGWRAAGEYVRQYAFEIAAVGMATQAFAMTMRDANSVSGKTVLGDMLNSSGQLMWTLPLVGSGVKKLISSGSEKMFGGLFDETKAAKWHGRVGTIAATLAMIAVNSKAIGDLFSNINENLFGSERLSALAAEREVNRLKTIQDSIVTYRRLNAEIERGVSLTSAQTEKMSGAIGDIKRIVPGAEVFGGDAMRRESDPAVLGRFTTGNIEAGRSEIEQWSASTDMNRRQPGAWNFIKGVFGQGETEYENLVGQMSSNKTDRDRLDIQRVILRRMMEEASDINERSRLARELAEYDDKVNAAIDEELRIRDSIGKKTSPYTKAAVGSFSRNMFKAVRGMENLGDAGEISRPYDKYMASGLASRISKEGKGDVYAEMGREAMSQIYSDSSLVKAQNMEKVLRETGKQFYVVQDGASKAGDKMRKFWVAEFNVATGEVRKFSMELERGLSKEAVTRNAESQIKAVWGGIGSGVSNFAVSTNDVSDEMFKMPLDSLKKMHSSSKTIFNNILTSYRTMMSEMELPLELAKMSPVQMDKSPEQTLRHLALMKEYIAGMPATVGMVSSKFKDVSESIRKSEFDLNDMTTAIGYLHQLNIKPTKTLSDVLESVSLMKNIGEQIGSKGEDLVNKYISAATRAGSLGPRAGGAVEEGGGEVLTDLQVATKALDELLKAAGGEGNAQTVDAIVSSFKLNKGDTESVRRALMGVAASATYSLVKGAEQGFAKVPEILKESVGKQSEAVKNINQDLALRSTQMETEARARNGGQLTAKDIADIQAQMEQHSAEPRANAMQYADNWKSTIVSMYEDLRSAEMKSLEKAKDDLARVFGTGDQEQIRKYEEAIGDISDRMSRADKDFRTASMSLETLNNSARNIHAPMVDMNNVLYELKNTITKNLAGADIVQGPAGQSITAMRSADEYVRVLKLKLAQLEQDKAAAPEERKGEFTVAITGMLDKMAQYTQSSASAKTELSAVPDRLRAERRRASAVFEINRQTYSQSTLESQAAMYKPTIDAIRETNIQIRMLFDSMGDKIPAALKDGVSNSMKGMAESIRKVELESDAAFQKNYALASSQERAAVSYIEQLREQGKSIEEIFADAGLREFAKTSPLLGQMADRLSREEMSVRLQAAGDVFEKSTGSFSDAVAKLIAHLDGVSADETRPAEEREAARSKAETLRETASAEMIGGSKTFKRFASGGFTGAGGKKELAGLVHKGEYVVPSEMKEMFPLLEQIRTGKLDVTPGASGSGRKAVGLLMGALDGPPTGAVDKVQNMAAELVRRSVLESSNPMGFIAGVRGSGVMPRGMYESTYPAVDAGLAIDEAKKWKGHSEGSLILKELKKRADVIKGVTTPRERLNPAILSYGSDSISHERPVSGFDASHMTGGMDIGTEQKLSYHEKTGRLAKLVDSIRRMKHGGVPTREYAKIEGKISSLLKETNLLERGIYAGGKEAVRTAEASRNFLARTEKYMKTYSTGPDHAAAASKFAKQTWQTMNEYGYGNAEIMKAPADNMVGRSLAQTETTTAPVPGKASIWQQNIERHFREWGGRTNRTPEGVGIHELSHDIRAKTNGASYDASKLFSLPSNKLQSNLGYRSHVLGQNLNQYIEANKTFRNKPGSADLSGRESYGRDRLSPLLSDAHKAMLGVDNNVRGALVDEIVAETARHAIPEIRNRSLAAGGMSANKFKDMKEQVLMESFEAAKRTAGIRLTKEHTGGKELPGVEYGRHVDYDKAFVRSGAVLDNDRLMSEIRGNVEGVSGARIKNLTNKMYEQYVDINKGYGDKASGVGVVDTYVGKLFKDRAVRMKELQATIDYMDNNISPETLSSDESIREYGNKKGALQRELNELSSDRKGPGVKERLIKRDIASKLEMRDRQGGEIYFSPSEKINERGAIEVDMSPKYAPPKPRTAARRFGDSIRSGIGGAKKAAGAFFNSGEGSHGASGMPGTSVTAEGRITGLGMMGSAFGLFGLQRGAVDLMHSKERFMEKYRVMTANPEERAKYEASTGLYGTRGYASDALGMAQSVVSPAAGLASGAEMTLSPFVQMANIQKAAGASPAGITRLLGTSKAAGIHRAASKVAMPLMAASGAMSAADLALNWNNQKYVESGQRREGMTNLVVTGTMMGFLGMGKTGLGSKILSADLLNTRAGSWMSGGAAAEGGRMANFMKMGRPAMTKTPVSMGGALNTLMAFEMLGHGLGYAGDAIGGDFGKSFAGMGRLLAPTTHARNISKMATGEMGDEFNQMNMLQGYANPEGAGVGQRLMNRTLQLTGQSGEFAQAGAEHGWRTEDMASQEDLLGLTGNKLGTTRTGGKVDIQSQIRFIIRRLLANAGKKTGSTYEIEKSVLDNVSSILAREAGGLGRPTSFSELMGSTGLRGREAGRTFGGTIAGMSTSQDAEKTDRYARDFMGMVVEAPAHTEYFKEQVSVESKAAKEAVERKALDSEKSERIRNITTPVGGEAQRVSRVKALKESIDKDRALLAMKTKIRDAMTAEGADYFSGKEGKELLNKEFSSEKYLPVKTMQETEANRKMLDEKFHYSKYLVNDEGAPINKKQLDAAMAKAAEEREKYKNAPYSVDAEGKSPERKRWIDATPEERRQAAVTAKAEKERFQADRLAKITKRKGVVTDRDSEIGRLKASIDEKQSEYNLSPEGTQDVRKGLANRIFRNERRMNSPLNEMSPWEMWEHSGRLEGYGKETMGAKKEYGEDLKLELSRNFNMKGKDDYSKMTRAQAERIMHEFPDVLKITFGDDVVNKIQEILKGKMEEVSRNPKPVPRGTVIPKSKR